MTFLNRASSTRVYLDYAATTPLSARVAESMRPFEREEFGNPRSLHVFGKHAKKVFDDARSRVGSLIGVTAEEVFFTHGGTDGNVKAITGVLNALQDEGRELSSLHIIISAIEHTSVRSCAEMFSRRGVSVSYAPVTREGIVDVDALSKLVRRETVFVSVMLVNNEIGTIQPLTEISRVLRQKKSDQKHPIVFHSDASQAPLWLSVRLKDLGVDMLTLDGHKMYGPKGAGALIVSHSVPYAGLCGVSHKLGDGVDGTPNIPGIVGFTEALAESEERRGALVDEIQKLRDYFISRIEERFPEARIHGHRDLRVANNVNVSFSDIEGEFLATQLSEYGIAVSAKSACLSGGGEGSYVLERIDAERKNSAIRFTLGYETTQEDIDYVISVLVDVLA